MKRKFNRPILILSGIIVTVLISISLVIILFSPELLPSSADAQSEATTEIFAMDTYITMTAYGRDAETAELLSFALQMAEETDGALEPTISLYVMGAERAIEYWQQHQNFDMILITEDGEIYLTDGIADNFTLDSYHSNMTVHVIQDEEM